jgi:diacylglycerol kinase family enzyme
MPDDANLSNPPRSTDAPTARLRIRRVEAVVNPLSGGVGPGAAEALERLLAAHGYGARVCEAKPRDLACAVRAAVDRAPDLVVILAGDGTAAMAARRAGPEGPLIAPLAGGTMNMLPHALYGPLGWREALEATLESGEERWVSGGEVDSHPFYVAAILGAPTLWARAREAMRKGRLDLALARARTALNRTFSGPLTYHLDNGVEGSAEALALLCPLVSRRMHGETALEVAALDVRNAAETFRLGLNALTGDWRNDPAVIVHLVAGAEAKARGSIPAMLDGEPLRLASEVSVRFVPRAFRSLVPSPPPA